MRCESPGAVPEAGRGEAVAISGWMLSSPCTTFIHLPVDVSIAVLRLRVRFPTSGPAASLYVEAKDDTGWCGDVGRKAEEAVAASHTEFGSPGPPKIQTPKISQGGTLMILAKIWPF